MTTREENQESNGPAPVSISTHTEWDTLKEVVVGIATGAQIPTVKDESMHSTCYGALPDEEFACIKTGPFPDRVINESNEDLDLFADKLKELGIKVHRPPILDFTEIYRTGDWAVDGYYAYCPRDTVLTVGKKAIAAPMVLRHRQNEASRLFSGMFDMVSAPVPRLLDSMYDRSHLGSPTLKDHEPAFDAANCLKMGRDILYLISNTGNTAGANWLQEHLGSEYKVHKVKNIYSFVHIDSTFTVLRPGLVLLCPARVNEDNLPEVFKGWDRIYAPEPEPTSCIEGWGGASKWIAMNLLSLSPHLAAVEESQVGLMRVLARYGIESIPIRLRHVRTLGGGPHCVTLDLVREGKLESYT